MQDFIANLLMGLGLGFVALGVFGIYRFKHFFPRILIGSKIDTVGYLTLLTGIIVKRGFSEFSLKVAVIIILMLIVNPLLSHTVARSAYLNGYRVGKG